jgi:preprotein translocase subunit YajC
MDFSFVPLLAMFAVFYFLIIRPQIKESEAHDKLVAGLVKGDRVVTRSGLHGKVIRVEDDTVGIEIAKNTAVTLDKAAVVRKLGDDSPGSAKE